jgi:hypothetical protein
MLPFFAEGLHFKPQYNSFYKRPMTFKKAFDYGKINPTPNVRTAA